MDFTQTYDAATLFAAAFALGLAAMPASQTAQPMADAANDADSEAA
jgi:hypothetical protein